MNSSVKRKMMMDNGDWWGFNENLFKVLGSPKTLGDIGSSFSDVFLILEKAVSDRSKLLGSDSPHRMPDKHAYRLQSQAHTSLPC